MVGLPTVGDNTNQWGAILNEFLLVSLNPDGTLKSPGFANPMAAASDLIVGGPSGSPTRLPVGANGFFLGIVGGALAWLPVPSGFANPMINVGDLIAGSTGGAPIRLPIGAAGQVLGVSSGAPAWVANPAGFVNPMTAVSDIIVGGAAGAAQRLGVGANGQVLGVVAGALAYLTNPAGFANPMTSVGDLISGGTSGIASRLPVGANGQFLGVASGAPTWLPVPSSPFQVMSPSGDTTGTTDDANFNNAVTALPNGGTIFLLCGATPYYTKAGWVLPAQTTAGSLGGNPVSIEGIGMPKLIVKGSALTGIYYHRTSGYGAQFNPGSGGAQPPVGYIHNVWICGLQATGASIGLDVGDGWGYDIKIHVTDFTGVGAVGCRINNHIFWTEKNNRFDIHSSNNTTGILLDTEVGDVSHEYNWYNFTIFCNQNQNGIVVQNGVNNGGVFMFIRGNMCQTTATGASPPTNNTAMLTLLGVNTRFYQSQIWVKVEFNQTTQYPLGSVKPWTIFSDGNGHIKQTSGQITCSLGGIQMQGAEFSFSGMIDSGDIPAADNGGGAGTSSLFPSPPVINTSWHNTGPDALVTVTGGFISGITINQTPTSLTTGCIFVAAGGALLISGTGTPTISVIPARFAEF